MKHRKKRDNGKASSTSGRTDSSEEANNSEDSKAESETKPTEAWRTGHDSIPLNASPMGQKPGRHRRY